MLRSFTSTLPLFCTTTMPTNPDGPAVDIEADQEPSDNGLHSIRRSLRDGGM